MNAHHASGLIALSFWILSVIAVFVAIIALLAFGAKRLGPGREK